MNPKASVVITTYNREPLLRRTLESFAIQEYKDYEVIVVDDGDDAGQSHALCTRYEQTLPSIKYFKRVREPGTHYSNPAIPNNIGIRQASGDIIILQNAECYHSSKEVIKAFVDSVSESGPIKAVFAQVQALKENKGFDQWYVHATINPRPFFFCGALPRQTFLDLRGFDEDFLFYGFDDNQFADRLRFIGVETVFSRDIRANHQWHGWSYKPEDAERNLLNAKLYQEKSEALKQGRIGPVANIGRDWGVLL